MDGPETRTAQQGGSTKSDAAPATQASRLDPTADSLRPSEERRARRRRSITIVLVGILLIFMVITVVSFISTDSSLSSLRRQLIAPLFGLLATIAGFYFGASSVAQDESDAKAAVDKALIRLQTDEKSFANLLTYNRKEIEQYQVQTRNRARLSFLASLVAMTAGLIILAVGATVAVRDPTTENKVFAAIVTAIGGALSSYITKTFINVHQKALDQLGLYFRQPLVSSYLLTAERIAQELAGDDKKQKAYEDIIKNVLNVAVEQSRPARNAEAKRSNRPSTPSQSDTS